MRSVAPKCPAHCVGEIHAVTKTVLTTVAGTKTSLYIELLKLQSHPVHQEHSPLTSSSTFYYTIIKSQLLVQDEKHSLGVRDPTVSARRDPWPTNRTTPLHDKTFRGSKRQKHVSLLISQHTGHTIVYDAGFTVLTRPTR